MRVTINNVRGIQSADFEMAGLVAICGDNNSGKSSILKSIGAVLSGSPMPRGMAKKDAGALVREGGDFGTIEITGPEGALSLRYPGAEISSTGRAPRASVYACGIISMVDLSPAERSAALIEYLKAKPTDEDLAMALRTAGARENDDARAWRDEKITEIAIIDRTRAAKGSLDQISELVKMVAISGWDQAAEEVAKAATKLKGQWEAATGEKRWGVAKAAGWRPAMGWSADMETMRVEDLETKLTAACAAQQSTVIQNAVTADQYDKRRINALRIVELEDALDAAEDARKIAKGILTTARATMAALPNDPSAPGIPCPHCGTALQIKNMLGSYELSISNVAIVTARQLAEQRDARAAAAGDLANAEQQFGIKSRAVTEADLLFNQAGDDADYIEANPSAPAEAAASGPSPDSAAITRLRAQIKMLADVRQAAQLHAAIVRELAIADLLGPQGLRRARLLDCLAGFNDAILAPLWQKAAWPAVTVDTAEGVPEFRYGGRHYDQLSESERWRTRVILQIAQARIDQSCVVLVDGVDILASKSNRLAFVNLMLNQPFPAVATISYGAADMAPNLDANNLGHTHWIASGVMEPLAAALERGKAA